MPVVFNWVIRLWVKGNNYSQSEGILVWQCTRRTGLAYLVFVVRHVITTFDKFALL
jgi:hypothetical protein